MLRVDRRSSGVPTRASSLRTACEAAEAEMPRRRAAALKLSSSATARNTGNPSKRSF